MASEPPATRVPPVAAISSAAWASGSCRRRSRRSGSRVPVGPVPDRWAVRWSSGGHQDLRPGCRGNRVAGPGGPPMTIAPPTDPAQVRPGPASPTAVIGDGTTVTSRVRTRWQRARWPITAVAVFLTVALISSLLTARTSTVPLAPDNPGDAGARALAQILRDQGVRVVALGGRGDLL